MRCSSGAAEVEHPMPQTKLLGGQLLLLLPRHRNGRRLRRADHLEVGDVHLDLAGAQPRVARRLGPELPPCRPRESPSPPPAAAARSMISGGVQSGLQESCTSPAAVAQIDEHQSAEIPPPMDPPAETDLGPTSRAGQRAGRWVRSAVAPGRAALDHGANALRRRRGRGRTHQGSCASTSC